MSYGAIAHRIRNYAALVSRCLPLRSDHSAMIPGLAWPSTIIKERWAPNIESVSSSDIGQYFNHLINTLGPGHGGAIDFF